MPFHHTTLPNGLTLIGETNPDAVAVGIGLFVRTGSRDESPDVAGVSHFLEHMVFKGTPRRTALDVNREFDRIGADYNAYTSEENTVFHAAVLPEYLPEAVDLLTDILRPSLRPDDFVTEKQVILEEIGMYEDQPGFMAYDQARKFFFDAHPLGNSVLGTTASVGALTAEQMRSYFDQRYVGPNVLAVAAGNYDWSHFVDLITRQCGHWPGSSAPRVGLVESVGRGGVKVVRRAGSSQEHVVCISAGPPAESPMRYAADCLALILGDDTGSRIYWALVDPGHVESADTSYHENQGAGTFYTAFSGDPERTDANLAILRGVLSELQRHGPSEEELRQAQTKITSRLVRGNERTRNRMMALGSCWTYLQTFHDVDQEMRAYDAVTLNDLVAVLERYPLDQPTTLAYGPLEQVSGVRAAEAENPA